MDNSRSFQFALLVSILIHSVFFLTLPHMPFTPSKRSLEKIKIIYYKIKEKPPVKKVIMAKVEEPIVQKLPDIKKEDILKPEPLKAKAEQKQEKKAPSVVKNIKETKVKEKEFEAVVKEEQDARKKATYISYYKAVREKIRRYADRNYPKNRNLGEGEVFLSFVIASSGELLQVKVVDEKSIQYPSLRNIAINSIRDASPFPPFPKGMSQYQITFNVIISFELNR